MRSRRFDIADSSLHVSGIGVARFPSSWPLFEVPLDAPGKRPAIAIAIQERADLNDLKRVNGAWHISRHRPYLYLPKVLAYEGFEREDLFLLVHSCFLVDREGKGHLFLATSGSGKSTLARKMRGLMTGGNDETNVLCRRDGILYGYSTPFYTISKLKQAVISNISAPLRQIYLLRKEDKRPSYINEPLAGDALWRYLVEGQVSTPYTKREYFAAYHRMVNDLCDHHPVHPFHHNLNDTPERIATIIGSSRP